LPDVVAVFPPSLARWLPIKDYQIRRNTGEKCGCGVKKKIEGFGEIAADCDVFRLSEVRQWVF